MNARNVARSRVVDGRKDIKMEDNMMTNTVSEVQEPVVEAQTEEQPAEQTVEQPTEQQAEQPAEQPEQQHSQPQPRRVNQQFKAMRQEQERQFRQQIDQLQNSNDRLLEALKGYGYSGSAEEVAAQISAAQRGISIEEFNEQERQAAERAKAMMQNDPEYLAMKQKAEAYEQAAFDNLFKSDLAAIKKAFPDFKGKSIDDLGDQFAALRANGVDAVTAYAAMQQAKQATAKPVPPVMGAVNQTKAEKEFYSKEEYEAIIKAHPEYLDDQKFVDNIINKSMPKWPK